MLSLYGLEPLLGSGRALSRRTVRFSLFALTTLLTSCDPGAGVVGPDGSSVIEGRVEVSPSAAQSSDMPDDPSGIIVSIEGGTAVDVTDSDGEFRLETDSGNGSLLIRFSRGSMNLVIEVEGISPSTVVRIVVRLDDDEAVLLHDDRAGLVEFEGLPELVSVTGEAPARVVQLSLPHNRGERIVNIFEGETRFETDGDLLTIDGLIGAMMVGANVRIEGDAVRAQDGTLDAVSLKAETDDDDDNDDDGDDDDDDDDDDERCSGAVGAVTVESLTVADGAECSLSQTEITGNLDVGTGSVLVAEGVRVGGNVEAEGSESITLLGSIVGGNVEVDEGGAATLEGLTIAGNLEIEENSGPIFVAHNEVGGNLQVMENTGGVLLESNQVAENLQCEENVPAPTGGDNQAGSKADQCATL